MQILLAFNEMGSGDPLIILHGLFGSGRNWTSIARSLGRSWRVLTPDLRNHGNSPWSQEMNYPAMAGDVRKLMQEQGIASASIIGHSMGGKVAMTLALQSPEMVGHLVVADIAPIPYRPVKSADVAAMQAIDLNALASRQAADDALSATIAEPGVRGFLLQNLIRKDGHWHWRINLDVLASSMDVICGTLGMTGAPPFLGPALFICGALSNYVPATAKGAIRELFTNAEFATIPQAGHWLHAEQPQAFLDIVSNWLG